MAEEAQFEFHEQRQPGDARKYLNFSGARHWTASLLPALVGTTLPFWLRPPGFAFRWLSALEFLLVILLLHAGFSFLHAVFQYGLKGKWHARRLLGATGICLVTAFLLGVHVNGSIPPHNSVPSYIFVVYGLTTLFAGVLYVVPPFSFSERVGGEVILAEGLGMLPVLGAYLVQVGDLNRTVYLAAMPLVVATGLWVWADELISMEADQIEGRNTMVILFGPRFSGRIVVTALSALFCASVLLSVVSTSLNPLALIALLLVGLLWKIVAVSWNGYANATQMLRVRMNAFLLHLTTCIIIAISSLATIPS